MSPDSVVKDSLTTESDGKIFDHHRRATEALEADVTDLQEIEQLEKQVGRHTKITLAAAKPAKKTTKGKKA